MPKVYLSPSGQIHNVGVGNYGTEEARCRKVAELAAKILKAAGVQVDMTPRSWNSTLADSTWLNRVVGRSNAFGAHAHIAIHTNAGGRTSDGTDAWHYPGSAKGKKLTEAIYTRVARVSPGSDGGIHTSPVFYETKAARAPVCYLEMAFHTNKADAASIVARPHLYAEAIAAGILEYLGVKAKPAPAPKPEEDGLAPTDRIPATLWHRLADRMVMHYLRSADPFSIEGWRDIDLEATLWTDPHHLEATDWTDKHRLLAVRTSSALGLDKSPNPTKALWDALRSERGT
jgi:hypothetical protein